LHAWAIDPLLACDERAVDLDAVREAVAGQARRVTPGIAEVGSYLDRQVADESNREVLGPLLAGSGASGGGSSRLG
jgi:hypothetical protein